MIVLKIILVAVGIVLSVILFRRAASTLDIGKINVISYIMYLFFAQSMIGASMVYLGDRNHYTMKYVLHQSSFDIMFYSTLATAILFPLTICVLYRLLNFNMKTAYAGYLEKATNVRFEKKIFWAVAAIGILCVGFLMLYMFAIYRKVHYFPILRLLRTPAGFDIGIERQLITSVAPLGERITNLMLHLALPLLSYVAFAYAWAVKKSVRWWIAAVVLIGSAVLGLTSNFEKSPVVFYLFVLLLIILYVRGRLPRLLIWGFLGVIVLYMVFIYGKSGFDFSGGIDIYNGPIGRTVFTQVGTMILHFDLFPETLPFLSGRSLSPTAMKILGIDGSPVRSGKAVMDFYGTEKVYDGTGGVMNTLWIGEAYANFGYIGMVFSILYVAVFIALFVFVFVKLQKNPFNIAVFAFLTNSFAHNTQTGFTDFIYNFQFILVIALTVAVNLFPKVWKNYIGPRISGRRHQQKTSKEESA